MHLHHPLHKIHQWTGKYFIPSWLWKVGVCLDLGHGGQCCPCYREGAVFPEEFWDDMPDEEDDSGDHGGIDKGKPTSTEISGAKVMVIVHTNGIHYLPVRMCRCEDGPPEDIQMMQLGYYPSTYKSIKTMFTFQLLDDYLLANLECQTSGHHYYQKLRRMTNKAAPHLVPVGCHLAL
jgi:CxC2 like cysteine cluster associated with KDZ transposases